jgi:hypothetical protein
MKLQKDLAGIIAMSMMFDTPFIHGSNTSNKAGYKKSMMPTGKYKTRQKRNKMARKSKQINRKK